MKKAIYTAKVFLAISSFLFFAITSGCSSGAVQVVQEGGTSSPTSGGISTGETPVAGETSAGTGRGTLSWDPPALYSDGTQIAPGDIKEYRIYFSLVSGAYSAGNYYVVTAPSTSINIRVLSLPKQRYYFVVTAVDASNRESDFSGEVDADLAMFN